jgi:hypothetical protein
MRSIHGVAEAPTRRASDDLRLPLPPPPSSEPRMVRRLTILLVLHLLSGAARVRLAAQEGPGRRRIGFGRSSRTVEELALEVHRKFLPHAGKRIRRIRVRNLDVFGPRSTDTTAIDEIVVGGASQQPGTGHGTTVRRNLPFQGRGSSIPAMADSERILREPFVHPGCPNRRWAEPCRSQLHRRCPGGAGDPAGGTLHRQAQSVATPPG